VLRPLQVLSPGKRKEQHRRTERRYMGQLQFTPMRLAGFAIYVLSIIAIGRWVGFWAAVGVMWVVLAATYAWLSWSERENRTTQDRE
jgi:NADH:ubiquinone oxidoreductase subunit 2 (subunit N)